jgi:glutaredoxin
MRNRIALACLLALGTSSAFAEKVPLDEDQLRAVSGKGTVPQVFIGGKLIGGADEVEAHFGAAKKAA